MFEPTKTIVSLQHQHIEKIKHLNIICWNVAKLTDKEEFKSSFEQLVKKEDLNYFILQEVKSDISFSLDIFEKYSYIMCPNIETKSNIYGIMNIFNISCSPQKAFLSSKKELKMATYKSILITKHKINAKSLLIVNIHALNFVSLKDFEHELNSLKLELKKHDGPLIVAGDFNTWSKKRILLLNNFCEELFLSEVISKEDKIVKKVFKNVLDYILFRGLILNDSKVIDTKNLSDHNPIIAKFTI